ncbi:uncharacterized protein LOC117140115 [Drosophila mauritiana]|uniref:Uncharacterized protein LOC117140115 n=1 Tax=Drosophila mauritiana TaxID=7226 RepID=A0A6P8JRP2_DROMA|nr:uncharacterized protein LOC117140115 [Drosophila mauritiana]
MKDPLNPNPSAQGDAIAVTIPLADDSKASPIHVTNAMDCDAPERPLELEKKADDKSSRVITVDDSKSDKPLELKKMADDESAVVINADATSGSKKQKKRKNKKTSKGTQKATSRPLTMPVSAKDALMVLNELKGVTIDKMEVKRKHDGPIMAYIVVNSKKYKGKGSSLASARNAACEKALQGILTTKMKAVLDEPENSSGSDEDDLLGKMASFAVHKLAEEWKSNDIDVAAMYNDLKKKLTPGVDPKASSPGKPLPKSWKNMDPWMVLTYMRPQIKFKVSGSTGTNQNKTVSMTVRVDNCEFNADGPSKKVARYKLTALVCNKLFGTEYPQK